ncbi:hypothetical protein KUCAC02_034459 [Chaenocephalus aceratus]|nr:hypothetical protein KUCAC02_034459 [Chaenocephalus aceratus]
MSGRFKTGGKARAKAKTRSSRAGLQFPVGRVYLRDYARLPLFVCYPEKNYQQYGLEEDRTSEYGGEAQGADGRAAQRNGDRQLSSLQRAFFLWKLDVLQIKDSKDLKLKAAVIAIDGEAKGIWLTASLLWQIYLKMIPCRCLNESRAGFFCVFLQ